MDGWHVALISVAVPALITALFPYLSKRAQASQQARLTDADIGAKIRDELRADNEALRTRVETVERENADLRGQVSSLTGRITRLEDALRRHGHHDELEGLG